MAIEHKDIAEANLHQPKGASTATSGQRMQADGVGGSAFVDNDADLVNVDDISGYFVASNVEAVLAEIGNRQYASMYINGNNTSQSASGAGTNDKWTTSWATDIAVGVGTDNINGEFDINVAGDYCVCLSLSLSQTGASAATWLIKIGVDSGSGFVMQNALKVGRDTSSTTVGAVAITGPVTLSVGDKIAIFFERTSGTVDMVFEHCNFSINKISI